MNIAVNQFAINSHTPEKGSHYAGDWEEVVALVAASEDRKPGFRDGVLEVTVPPAGFYSGVVKLTEDMSADLKTAFERRRDGEEPVLQTRVSPSMKQRAESVRIIIYHRDVLGADATTDAEWEIVTVLAEGGEPAPMAPVTMARNFLELEGGTKGEFSADDFAKSIMYWAQHAVAG